MNKIFSSLAIALALLISSNVAADSFQPIKSQSTNLDQNDLPSDLKDWENWALDGYEKDECSFVYNNSKSRYCYYISALDLNVDGSELSFSEDIVLKKKGYVLLPGSFDVFPYQVISNGKEIPVVNLNGLPYVLLDAGEYQLKGRAKSKENIRYFSIPSDVAILTLTKDGKEVLNPTIDNSGILRLETQAAEKKETDDITYTVFRKIEDNIPLYMTVRIDLNVSGSQRVENLGKIIPDNFALMGISSSVPAHVQQNGDLVAEVSAGNWWIELKFRQIKPSLELRSDASPVDNEIWVFAKDTSRRVIQVPSSVAQIQTKMTNLPEDWKSFPGYEVKKGDEIKLNVIEYLNKPQDELNLNRNIKLSFDGKFYSIKDRITGNLKENGQISLTKPFVLSSVEINSVPQSIILTETKTDGFEVRKGVAEISTISRIDNLNQIKAAGYNRNFDQVNWNLNLSPGYNLFHVSGADSVSSSWISNWNLLSIFMVVLLGVIFYYLFGIKKAVIAEAAFILLQPVMPQFIVITFFLCGIICIERYLGSENKFLKLLNFIKYSLSLFLILATLGFMIVNIRYAIYPVLNTGFTYSPLMALIDANFLSGFYFTVAVIYILYRIYANPQRPTANKVLWTLAVFIGLFVFSGMIGFILDQGSNLFSLGLSRNYYAPEMSISQNTYYDSLSSGYYGEPSAKIRATRNTAKLNSLNSSQSVAQGYINNDAKLANYQSLNVAKNRIQTGVGFPEWSERNINISLKGPISEQDSFKILLISPLQNLIIAFMQLILAFLTLYFMLSKDKPVMKKSKSKKILSKTLAVILLGLFAALPAKAAEYPSSDILSELRNKLTRVEVPACIPQCLSIPEASINLSGNQISLDLALHSQDELVVPLPVIRADGYGFVKISKIMVNGVQTPYSLKKNDVIYILAQKGINKITIDAQLDNVERFSISSTVKINRLENGSDVLDVSKNSGNSQLYQITLKNQKHPQKSKASSELAKANIPPFFEVQKRLDIGTIWQVTTTINRLNQSTEASSIEIPLLDGEKIITSEGNLLKDSIRISFSPNENQKQYISILPVEESINLRAAPNMLNYREVWLLNVDLAWSFKTKGTKPLNIDNSETMYIPNPGESLNIDIYRSESFAGEVITFDKVDYNLSYGRSQINLKVNLNARSSEGGNHQLVLPKGLKVTNLTIDGNNYPVSQKDNILVFPVNNGFTKIYFVAEADKPDSNIWTFPIIDLKAPAVNIYQNMDVPSQRWLLFATGPVKGPAVLFWSQIPVWILLAFLLSRFKTIEVGFTSWFVLLLGLSQSNLMCTIMIIAWFVLMGIRNKYSANLKFKKLFQTVLAILTIMFVYSLIKGISNGLLGNWDMKISGNGSYFDWKEGGMWILKWYQDASAGILPSPKILSLPLWAYRSLMVLWSVWLSFSFVKWIKWGAKSYQKDGIWK